jgi:hypothetical protein
MINMVQLMMVYSMFYSINNSKVVHDEDLLNKLNRMIILGCSDEYINGQLREINMAFEYIG